MSPVWASLPVELVRDIFSFAAAADRRTACTLALVCDAARYWTAPALYHTVHLENARALKAFSAALASKPSHFAAQHVKHLCISAPGPLSAIHDVLALSAGVESLACGFSLAAYSAQFPASVAPRLSAREQHLLSTATRGGRWDDGIVSAQATHVRVQLSAESWDALEPARLRQWSCLTHLAVVFTPCGSAQDIPDAFDAAVRAADELKLALVLLQVSGGAARRKNAIEALEGMIRDRKEVRVIVEAAPLSPVKQWEVAAHGGASVWEHAEGEVARRRRVAAAEAAAVPR